MPHRTTSSHTPPATLIWYPSVSTAVVRGWGASLHPGVPGSPGTS